MASDNLYKKNVIKTSHIPTFMLIIGYVCYWIELYVLKATTGVTSLLASVLFCFVAGYIIYESREKFVVNIKGIKEEGNSLSPFTKFLIVSGILISLSILACVLYASTLPIHLGQESDALRAHISLPRQHLILNSFAHIPWSSYDLFYLPIQFGLAPYWLVTELPNKFPQFIFLLGILLTSFCLVKRLSQNNILAALLVVFAIVGTHGIGIQMGTAMIDLVICYLFLAVIESLLSGAFILAAIEFAFFVWAKPFVPIHTTLIILLLLGLHFLLKKGGFKGVSIGFNDHLALSSFRIKEFTLHFLLASLIVGGPFIAKSTYYAGTPIYPIGPGSIKINKSINYNSAHWESIQGSSKVWLDRDRYEYGYGRSPIAFLKHFWLISIPDKGVNNRFDYPLGLMYLLFLAPFLAYFFYSLKGQVFAIIPFLASISYFSWWFGTQQSRYLFVPILLIYIVVLAHRKSFSKVLLSAMIVAMLLTGISVFRTHKGSFGLEHEKILRKKDLELVERSRAYLKENRTDSVELDSIDIGYAQFPVDVRRKHWPHILEY